MVHDSPFSSSWICSSASESCRRVDRLRIDSLGLSDSSTGNRSTLPSPEISAEDDSTGAPWKKDEDDTGVEAHSRQGQKALMRKPRNTVGPMSARIARAPSSKPMAMAVRRRSSM